MNCAFHNIHKNIYVMHAYCVCILKPSRKCKTERIKLRKTFLRCLHSHISIRISNKDFKNPKYLSS